jgi:hypothetical protein
LGGRSTEREEPADDDHHGSPQRRKQGTRKAHSRGALKQQTATEREHAEHSRKEQPCDEQAHRPKVVSRLSSPPAAAGRAMLI